jgi:hypothetical protein
MKHRLKQHNAIDLIEDFYQPQNIQNSGILASEKICILSVCVRG